MSNKEEELKMGQTKTGDKSETEGAASLRQPVFIRRAKGMPLAEFKKVCIERFKKAGLIKPEPQEESNSLGDINTHRKRTDTINTRW